MQSDFSTRQAKLQKLADHLLTEEFSSKFTDAYIKDTAFVKKNVIKRELLTPSALLGLKREEDPMLAGRLRLGEVAVMIPKNSVGLTLAKAIASSYLMGNKTLIYFPSQLKETAPVYSEMLLNHLDNIEIASNVQSSSLFMRNCFHNPDIKAIVIYGDDSWLNAYWSLAKQTQTKIIFEGPGNDPLVVMADADIESAVNGAIIGGLNNGGQSCSAFERFFIHEDIMSEFSSRLSIRLKELKYGSPYDNETDIGPIASKIIFRRIIKQIDESVQMGAELKFGGEVFNDEITGLPIITPAVINNCSTEMPLVSEETFGPVFPLVSFTSTDKLIEALDKTKYGLNASLYGSAPTQLRDYLNNSHRNFYINSTCVCEDNLKTRLMDGGFKSSGIIWDFTVENIISYGRRTLTLELSNPIQKK